MEKQDIYYHGYQEHEISIAVSNDNSKSEKKITVKVRGSMEMVDTLVKLANEKFEELNKPELKGK